MFTHQILKIDLVKKSYRSKYSKFGCLFIFPHIPNSVDRTLFHKSTVLSILNITIRGLLVITLLSFPTNYALERDYLELSSPHSLCLATMKTKR